MSHTICLCKTCSRSKYTTQINRISKKQFIIHLRSLVLKINEPKCETTSEKCFRIFFQYVADNTLQFCTSYSYDKGQTLKKNFKNRFMIGPIPHTNVIELFLAQFLRNYLYFYLILPHHFR